MRRNPCVDNASHFISANRLATQRGGYSLIELVVAMTSATLLLGGLGGAVIVASRTFRPEGLGQYQRTIANEGFHTLLNDLRLATSFLERSELAATFSVPDRDADGIPETVRYAWSGQSGAPLFVSYNGGQQIVVADDVRLFSFSYLTRELPSLHLPAEQEGSTILLLVNDSTSLNVAEVLYKNLIESWDFVVLVKGANDAEADIRSVADQCSAIIFAGELDADKFATLAQQLADHTAGIVIEHPELVDEFGLATKSATGAFTNSIAIADTGHHITSLQPSGNYSVGLLQSQYWVEGTLAPDLNTLASVSSRPALVTVDQNELLVGNSKAAGRRVFLPWGHRMNDSQLWSETGLQLTQRSIEWATGIGAGSTTLRKLGYDTIFPSQNSRAKTQLSTRATLKETGKIRSISAYVGGKSDDIRFALYSNDNGEPGALLTQSAVGRSGSAMAWVTLPVPEVELPAGDYWLAIVLKDSNQKFNYISSYSNAGERDKSNDAVSNGFLPNWGKSDKSFSGARSIYATYEVIP